MDSWPCLYRTYNSQSALNNVVNSTSDLCQQVAHKLKRKFSEIVDSPMTESDKRAMIHKLNNIECEPFEGIGTEYLQEKHYKESFGYLVSALTAPIQQCRKYPYTIIHRRHIYLVHLACAYNKLIMKSKLKWVVTMGRLILTKL